VLRSGTRTLFSWTWKLKRKKAIEEVKSASGRRGAVGGNMEGDCGGREAVGDGRQRRR
jgi:hypothetical protein